ncbi:MAG: methyltransferase domain-containing protein [Elusimicrobia bacterium]|nr:methyltransferase domain-containing protein [Elusimicrobiota bacterium]
MSGDHPAPPSPEDPARPDSRAGAPVGAVLYDERYFEEDCGGAEFYRLFGPRILKPALSYSFRRAAVAPGMSVLDIGCGRGEVLYHVRQAGAWGVGTDFSPAALGLARSSSGCSVARCDAKSLPFLDRAFDRVFLMGVVDHLHPWELERCFAEIGRVLKSDGFVLVHTCVNRHYYKNWSYGLRRWAARMLRAVRLPVRDPKAPRSESDIALHVNEHSASQLRRFFRSIGWQAEVEPRPNYKLALDETYGAELPDGLPIRPAPAWKARVHKTFFRWPLTCVLARELFAVAKPGKKA